MEPFVFLDDRKVPYRVQMWGDNAWLFYWHSFTKSWVSLRKVSQVEVWQFDKFAIPEQEANRLFPMR